MEKMTMKLPPLAVWCGNRQGATVEGLHPHSLTVDQAAHIIRLVEVVHPRLVAGLRKLASADDGAGKFEHLGDVARLARAILKEVQS